MKINLKINKMYEFFINDEVYFMRSDLIEKGKIIRKDTIERLDKKTIEKFLIKTNSLNRIELNKYQLFKTKEEIINYLKENIK